MKKHVPSQRKNNLFSEQTSKKKFAYEMRKINIASDIMCKIAYSFPLNFSETKQRTENRLKSTLVVYADHPKQQNNNFAQLTKLKKQKFTPKRAFPRRFWTEHRPLLRLHNPENALFEQRVRTNPCDQEPIYNNCRFECH